jgi:hypothetical protein
MTRSSYPAFESLDEDGRDALENDLKELIGEWNISGDETVLLPSDYLEVVAVRRRLKSNRRGANPAPRSRRCGKQS